MKRTILILWPSFLVAGAATAVFFAIFDPVDLSIFWKPLGPSQLGVYAEGFLLFYFFTALSSALTLFLEHGAAERLPR